MQVRKSAAYNAQKTTHMPGLHAELASFQPEHANRGTAQDASFQREVAFLQPELSIQREAGGGGAGGK